MRIRFQIHYQTYGNEKVALTANRSGWGELLDSQVLEMHPENDGFWSLELECHQPGLLEYRYLIRRDGVTERQEWGENHWVSLPEDADSCIQHDYWQAEPDKAYLHTAVFTDSILRIPFEPEIHTCGTNRVVIKVFAPYVNRHQCVGISGDVALFGNWKPEKALRMHSGTFPEWSITLNANDLPAYSNYKFVILERESGHLQHWEWGEPRMLTLPYDIDRQQIQYSGLHFRYQEAPWKGAGVALPVFSLRTDESWGCGDFGDLKKLVDWAALTHLQLIQTLPVNDTTRTGSRSDSYPYSAISIYALHPIYCAIKDLPPLQNQLLMDELRGQAIVLNQLQQLDYEQVYLLKQRYLQALYAEQGSQLLASGAYRTFYDSNREWLVPYAAFCYLRHQTGQADFRHWGEFACYDRERIEKLTASGQEHFSQIAYHYFVQFLLDQQLKDARSYAHEHGVVLKGDIPIGVNPISVEAWSEAELFNTSVQVGAPPDEFSVTGQNWGFPSYNWERMQQDGFSWWKKRFSKMADYFDAYRIDHILGFFRIWEIPEHGVDGLLGHFNPALPLSESDMLQFGFHFEKESMTTPYLTEDLLIRLFEKDKSRVVKTYLKKGKNGLYQLKTNCDSQQKIREAFSQNEPTATNLLLQNKLYSLCSEVLFIEDPEKEGLWHPRISAFGTERFRQLDDAQKHAFGRLYNDFFYTRNVSFWKEKALEKLPALLGATRMLACGEDLGMIPSCVPEVMHQLQILSLEIQRMPKTYGVLFENLNNVPYTSVCTTSTHDMNPIRAWWLENREASQQYYNQMLWKPGDAPWECNPELATLIVQNHLACPAMWVVLPWQDWMATDQKLRNPDPLSERINVPSNPDQYWCYRMHISLDQLLRERAFNARMREMIQSSGRC